MSSSPSSSSKKPSSSPSSKSTLFSSPSSSRSSLVIEETPWGPRHRTRVDASKGGMTQQSFRKESDINELVRRARVAGQWPPKTKEGLYGDFSDVPDFQTSLQHVQNTQDAFLKLPAEIRAAVRNDPGEFVARMRDPHIVALMVRHGLATTLEAPPSPATSRQTPEVDPSGVSSPEGRAAPAAKKNSSPTGSPGSSDA
ncbi:MAG: hypothetical protein IT285_03360 [Bdellovibrionales bacterium]|nr:hypothetical protein [Bdellovibrionales bacterium]